MVGTQGNEFHEHGLENERREMGGAVLLIPVTAALTLSNCGRRKAAGFVGLSEFADSRPVPLRCIAPRNTPGNQGRSQGQFHSAAFSSVS